MNNQPAFMAKSHRSSLGLLVALFALVLGSLAWWQSAEAALPTTTITVTDDVSSVVANDTITYGVNFQFTPNNTTPQTNVNSFVFTVDADLFNIVVTNGSSDFSVGECSVNQGTHTVTCIDSCITTYIFYFYPSRM